MISHPPGWDRERLGGPGVASRQQVSTALSPNGTLLAANSLQMLEEMRKMFLRSADRYLDLSGTQSHRPWPDQAAEK